VSEVLLRIEGLKIYFYTYDGVARAVDDVSMTLCKGKTLGLVGESGCGKSVTALSILRLIAQPPGRILSGHIYFLEREILNNLTEPEMRKIRGKDISMIFQEPMTSLNPMLRIGCQIAESIRLHLNVSKNEAWDRSVAMLKRVGIPSAEKRIKDYPHQLSGGMRQRAMIAMALSCNPVLMIADEPTTALDVTIQAQILDLMNKLKEDVGTSIILITHDLGVIAEMAQNVCVMYAGVVVESADVKTLFNNPLHPYTMGLLASIPRIDRHAGKKGRLSSIQGVVPSLMDLPEGCRFSDRCSQSYDPCRKWEPPLAPLVNTAEMDHLVRCWLYQTAPKN
jgi:peptide/nickel transport system ATP-binding protein